MSGNNCREFSIVASDCPCLLQLADPLNNILSLNLTGATVRPYKDTNHFHIQTMTGGAKVDGDASAFTAADIEDLICACATGSDEASGTVLPDRQVLSGADTWVIPTGLQSMAYYVSESGNPGTTPTMTTTAGTVALIVGEQGGFSVIKDQDSELVAPLTITTSIGDVVVVIWTI